MATLGTRKRVAFLEEWIDGTAIQSQMRQDAEVGNENAEPNISFVWSLYEQALNLFTRLLPLVPDNDSSSSGHQKRSLKDTLGRLFLWGDGFRDGRLEAILEESEDLKFSIISGLVAVGRTLVILQASLELELDVLLEKARLLLTELSNESDDDGELSSSSSDGDEHQHLVQRTQAATSLQTFVTCLMDLVPSMARTLNMAQQEPSEENNSCLLEFFVSGPAQPYVLKVFDRFAKADKRLIERLGEANWQRHVALRKVHAAENEASTPYEFADGPKSIFAPVSMFHDSGLGSSKPEQSSYAETVASHSSFVSSIADKEDANLRVPPTPKEVFEKRPFTCDICGHVLRMIKNRIDWKRHVFSDLKPYICTFSGCQHELLTFPTRKLWEDHEFTHHRIGYSWACLECSEVFPIAEDWRLHLKKKHRIHMTDTQLQVASNVTGRRKSRPYQDERCPLCQEVPGRSQRHFVSHVTKHMEEISLAALPNIRVSDSEADPETSDDNPEVSDSPTLTQQQRASTSNSPIDYSSSTAGLSPRFDIADLPEAMLPYPVLTKRTSRKLPRLSKVANDFIARDRSVTSNKQRFHQHNLHVPEIEQDKGSLGSTVHIDMSLTTMKDEKGEKDQKEENAQRQRGTNKLKVKTGCKNCKNRRVKCDNTRPQCIKCVRSGRRCDGYPGHPKPAELYPQSQDKHDEFKEKYISDWPDFHALDAANDFGSFPPLLFDAGPETDIPDNNYISNFTANHLQNKESASPGTPSTNINQSETTPAMTPNWEPYPPFSMGIPSRSTYDKYMTTPPPISANPGSANRTRLATTVASKETLEIPEKKTQPMK